METGSDLSGKSALVTAASAALGKAVALQLARVGADVYLVDADQDALDAVATEIRSLGVRAEALATDIAIPANCRAAVAAAIAAYGRLDILCNVATAFFPAHAQAMPESDWHATLAMNLSAPFFLFQAAVPHLLEQDGAVVNVTSCAAFMAQPFTAAYTASKAGLTQMTKALAKEYVDKPIRINCVAPGSMAISSGNRTNIPADVDMSKVQRLPPGRGLIEMERVAEVVAFLASEASRGIHGASLTIDNGMSLG
jgi:NAD(P)-dependent dehydrogenase (short-subunit alcohol dehydrogenase family)